MLKYLFIPSFILLSFIYPEEMPTDSFKRGYPITDSSFIGAYNASSKIEVKNGWGFYTNISFIYWQTLAHDLYYATRNNACDRHSDLNSAYDPVKQFADLKFNYKPGFKVGIGMNTTKDDWYTYLQYTWLHSQASRIAVNPEKVITTLYEDVDPEYPANNSLNRASCHQKNKLNIFDWILARSFYVGKKMTCDLLVGPKGFIIHSKDKIYTYPASASPFYRSFNNTNHSWGLGAKIGCNLNFMLGKGVRFFGSGALNLAYERTKLFFFAHDIPQASFTELFNYKDKKNAFVNITELSMGFGYGTLLWQERCYFDVSAAYEFQLWTNQFSHLAYANLQSNIINPYTVPGHPYHPSNLMMHGLTLSLRCDY